VKFKQYIADPVEYVWDGEWLRPWARREARTTRSVGMRGSGSLLKSMPSAFSTLSARAARAARAAA
jgi:hypothetical protein